MLLCVVLLCVMLLCLATASACSTRPDHPDAVRSWGTMREALRHGRSEARVALASLDGVDTVGVGALEGLAGEVTIVDGRVLVAHAEHGACRVAPAAPGDAATLLVTARVRDWQTRPLADCDDYERLDAAIGSAVRAQGFDPTQPTPVRIRGRASHAAYHVIAGACPIATPEGTPPWRFRGPIDAIELVGIYVEHAAGRLTHHVHRSHLHLVAPGHMGHLDEIALRDAVLLLPPHQPPSEAR